VLAPALPAPHVSPGADAGRSGATRSFLERYALVGLLLLLFAVCFALLPGFRSASVIGAVVNSQAIILMLALTATIALRTGSFDLSIAGVMVTSGAVIGVLTGAGVPWYLAIGAALLVGIAAGAINGFLVVKIGVDSFITTIGMFTALTGIGYAITNSTIVTTIPEGITEVARFKLLGLPLTTWFGWLLAVGLWYIYQRTPLGRYMLFIGGNTDASRLAGINVDRIRFGSFIASGLTASLIGVLIVGYLGAIAPSIGSQYLLTPFAAVFLGATTIAVGRFNSLGTLVALSLLAVGFTGLQLLGAPTWVNNVFNGLALMLAVALAKIVGRRNTVAR
jgi:ribose transport system permease protein